MRRSARAIFAALVTLAAFVDPLRAEEPEKQKEKFRLSDLLPRGFQRNPRIELSIVTELTPDGRKIEPPTPDRPAYFLTLDGGIVEEGEVIAGEKPPNAERLAAIMRGALATNGYLPATSQNRATIMIHYRYGSFNTFDAEVAETTTEIAGLRHLLLRASIVGGSRFAIELGQAIGRGPEAVASFRLRDAKTDWLVEQAMSNNLYFIVASAYDLEAGLRGEKKLLWRTKISTESQGLAMDDTVISLATSGAAYFGREMTESVQISPRLFKGKVEIGETTVVPDAAAAAPAPSNKKQ